MSLVRYQLNRSTFQIRANDRLQPAGTDPRLDMGLRPTFDDKHVNAGSAKKVTGKEA